MESVFNQKFRFGLNLERK